MASMASAKALLDSMITGHPELRAPEDAEHLLRSKPITDSD